MTFSPERLESALRAADALPETSGRAAAREIALSVLEFHRFGLERLVDLVRESGDAGETLLAKAARDEVLRHLFQLHDISLPLPEREPSLGSEPSFVPVQRLTRLRPDACDRCALCGGAVGDGHPHLLELGKRKVACACPACALLFDSDTHGQYRRIHPHAVRLGDLRIDDETWRALGVPVGLTFFSRRSPDGTVVAAFPGPAGAVETEVASAAWATLTEAHSVLSDLEWDVEAVLANRLDDPPAYFRVSIDHCYRLTGIVRSRWRGISGGDEYPRAVRGFFASLAASPS